MQRNTYKLNSKKQQGAASLLISLILLALITIITLYTAKNIMTEQKIAANDFRSKQAFEVSESGFQDALNFFKTSFDGTNIQTAFYNTDTSNPQDGINDVYIVTLANNSSASVTVTDASGTGQGPFSIASVGSSDDNNASHTISALSDNVNPLPNVPGNPLTAKASVIVAGSATVYNPEGHSTIWSGDDIDLGSNNSTATYVANPADGAYPTCMDTSMTCSGTQSSNKTSIGLDVIEYDSSLGNLTVEEMFINTFGVTRAVYRESRVTIDTTPANFLADADLATGEIIWVEGNLSINGGTIGCSYDVNGVNEGADKLPMPNPSCTDNPIKPSILIVNGDLSTAGNPVFYGLVYVIGNYSGGGGATTVEGAMVLGGSTTSLPSGSLDIWYNSDLLESLTNLGNYSALSGTWSDWN